MVDERILIAHGYIRQMREKGLKIDLVLGAIAVDADAFEWITRKGRGGAWEFVASVTRKDFFSAVEALFLEVNKRKDMGNEKTDAS